MALIFLHCSISICIHLNCSPRLEHIELWLNFTSSILIWWWIWFVSVLLQLTTHHYWSWMCSLNFCFYFEKYILPPESFPWLVSFVFEDKVVSVLALVYVEFSLWRDSKFAASDRLKFRLANFGDFKFKIMTVRNKMFGEILFNVD